MQYVAQRVICQTGRLQRASHLRSFSSTTAKEPLILVLDVDETLWRSHVPGVHKHKPPAKFDFKVEINAGGERMTSAPTAWTSSTSSSSQADSETKEQGRQSKTCHVTLRPGLKKFFNWIVERRSQGVLEGPWIFTQGSSRYLNAVIPQIDPDGEVFGDRILTRGACLRMQSPWPWVHKELTQVPCGIGEQARTERVILVENNVMSCLLYPDNGFMVHDWTGDNAFDRELRRVSTVLDDVLSEPSGDYASRLAAITPGHQHFREEMAHLHECILRGLPAGQNKDEAIKDLWWQALKAKKRLLDQQGVRK